MLSDVKTLRSSILAILVVFRKYCAQMNNYQTVVRCQICQLLKIEDVSRLDIIIFNLVSPSKDLLGDVADLTFPVLFEGLSRQHQRPM